MSGEKKRGRSKSGFLTGLMIVSTGLIAGFHGLELAMSEQNGLEPYSKIANRPDDERSQRAVTRQVSALDHLITVSLEQNKPKSAGNDSQGLAKLIEAAEAAETPKQKLADEARDDYPVVNRALKRDRAQMPDAPTIKEGRRDALTSFIEAANDRGTQNSGRATAQMPVMKAVLTTASNRDAPYADSADIALFAADMPLPAKLRKRISRGNNGLPLAARSHGSPYSRSPLVPRKLRSGKAFGGLAERAFQRRERRCMTTALYFEARSEPEAGQIAVGQVVMNRVRSPDYPDTICGVIYQGSQRRTGCQFSFTCDGKADKPSNKKQWERSKRLANKVLNGRVWLRSIGHATHYHANYVKPRWRRKMARIRQIGRHIFYKSPKVSVTHTYQRYMSGQRS